jgi:hypothetical protein
MSGTAAVLDTSWSDGWRVVIDSVGAGARESLPFDGTLSADSAVVLERTLTAHPRAHGLSAALRRTHRAGARG